MNFHCNYEMAPQKCYPLMLNQSYVFTPHKRSGHSLQAPVAEEACLVGLQEGLADLGDHEDSHHQAFGGDHPNDVVLPPFFSNTYPLHSV